MKTVFFILLLFVSSSAFSGSHNGYRLVFFDASPNKNTATTKLFMDYFNSYLPAKTYRCEDSNRFIGFEFVYMNQRPKAITDELVLASLGSNKEALEQLRKALRSFRNPEIDKGFDGLVVFKNDGEFHELTTIGSIKNGYKRTAQINSRKNINNDSLKTLFCGSLAELDYAYEGR